MRMTCPPFKVTVFDLLTVVPARNGETEDAILAELSVGRNGEQMKVGSVAGSSGLAKFNQLLSINERIAIKYA